MARLAPPQAVGQLDAPPLLVVAIVGGTNIGKSVLFNHLAGEVASAATPLAAGTKHPVALVPPEWDDAAALARLFESFALHPWHSAEEPLAEAPEHRLYWRRGAQVPPRLLLLDAPDVDSDAAVNWQRARAVRQSSDVLVAVLTQQKYNDAAVKQFFRAGVEADKPIVVVFNLCDLAEDREFWPQWLATFSAETGASPELVYVVPYDRAAAQQLRLPFYRLEHDGTPVAADLRQDLAALHFDAIKIRTFRGGARPRARSPARRGRLSGGGAGGGRRVLVGRRGRYRPARWCASSGPCFPAASWSTRSASGGTPTPVMVATGPRLLSPAGAWRKLAAVRRVGCPGSHG